jgi:hypothetical protein
MGQVCCQPISHARPHAGSPNGRSTMLPSFKEPREQSDGGNKSNSSLRRAQTRVSAAWDSLGSHYWAPPVPSNHERMLIPYIYTPVPCMRAGTSPTLVGGVLLRLPPGLRPTKGPR